MWVHDVLKCACVDSSLWFGTEASVCRCHRSSIHTIRLDSSTFHTYTPALSLSLSLSLLSLSLSSLSLSLLSLSLNTVFTTLVSSTLPHRLNAAFLSVEHEKLLISHCLSCLRNTRAFISLCCVSRSTERACGSTPENTGEWRLFVLLSGLQAVTVNRFECSKKEYAPNWLDWCVSCF